MTLTPYFLELWFFAKSQEALTHMTFLLVLVLVSASGMLEYKSLV